VAKPVIPGLVHELQGAAVVAQLEPTADDPRPSLASVPGRLGVELVGDRLDGRVLRPRIVQRGIDAPDGVAGVDVVTVDRDFGAVDFAFEDVRTATLSAAV